MTTRSIQAEKFYQKLQKKFSRRINLDRSRIFLALKKFNINPDCNISGSVLNVLGSDGKNSVILGILSMLIENKKRLLLSLPPQLFHRWTAYS